ncbi:MAG TPA: caspase family protein [Desulfobacterales bacterium]|nr:caspase family protein [Desulfobacterales bacterium]
MDVQGKPKWFLFITIKSYPHDPLPGVKLDAQRLYKVLSDNADGEILWSRWLNDSLAIKKNILKEIQNLGRANLSAQVIIYFGGHGHRVDGASYLLPYGAHWNSPLRDMISMEELGAAVEKIDVEEIVLILDCCYSGGLLGLATSLTEGLLQRADKACIIAATRAQRAALEGDTGGVFIPTLCEALTNPLLSNEHGQIAIQTAFDWTVQIIQERVDAMIRKLVESLEQQGQHIEAERVRENPVYRQKPVCICRRDRPIYLTRVKPLVIVGDSNG